MVNYENHQVETLDNYHIADLIKIDVEGHEQSVIEGATNYQ